MFRYVLMFRFRLPSPFRLLSPRLPGFPAKLGFVDYHLLIVFKVACCIKAWEGSMPGMAWEGSVLHANTQCLGRLKLV